MHRLVSLRAARLVAVLGGLAIFGFAGVSGAEAQAPVYDSGELTTIPQLANVQRAVDQIRRAYPNNLRNSRVGGRVQIEAIVDDNGRVEANSLRVLHAEHDGLAEAAMSVAPQLEFRPGQKDGRAVRSRIIIPIVFQP